MEAQQKAVNKVAGKISKTGKSLTKTGKTLTTTVTAPIVGLGVAAVKTAADFEASMDAVRAVSGRVAEKDLGGIISTAKEMGIQVVKGADATETAMNILSAKAEQMGAATKYSLSESADAFSYMAKVGWKTEEMLHGIEGIMYLAGATGEDLGRTSDIVTTAINAFGLKASDTTRLVNVLATAANETATDVSAMGNAFEYVAPIAGSLGYSAKDTAFALGLLANQGIDAEKAGTSLRSLLTNLAKPTKAMQKAMKELGVSLTDTNGETKSLDKLLLNLRTSFSGLSKVQKTQYAATIAGKTGMTGLLDIVNTTSEKFDRLSGAMANCDGAAKNMYDVATDNLQGKLVELKSAVEVLGNKFGRRLTPNIEKLTKCVRGAVDWVGSLSDKQVDLIIKIAGVAAAVGPVLLIVGKAMTTGAKMIKGIKNITNAMKLAKVAIGALNPTVLIVIGVVAALAVAAVVVYKNWDKIKKFFSGLGATLKIMAGKFSEFVASSKEKGSILGSVFQNIGNIVDGLKKIFGGVITFVKGVFTGDWKTAWEGVKGIFSGIFGTLGAVVKAPINGVIGIINSAIGHINKIKITVPEWVPSIGGKTFGGNIPKIPLLYKGTDYFSGGRAFIHDKGAEIVDLPRGTRVIPHDKSIKTAYMQGKAQGGRIVNINKLADTLVIRSDDDIDAIAEKIAQKLKDTADNTGDFDKTA